MLSVPRIMLVLVLLSVVEAGMQQCMIFFFLSLLGWHTLFSHASTKACLTGYHCIQLASGCADEDLHLISMDTTHEVNSDIK